MVSFVALIFPKPPLCALNTNCSVLSLKYSLNWFPHLVHLYILTLNRPKVHSLSDPCLCAVQFGHLGITFYLPEYRHNYYICYFHGTLISRFHVLLAKRTLLFQSSCAIAFGASFSWIPSTYRASTLAFGTGNHPIFITLTVPSGHEIHILNSPLDQHFPVSFFTYFLIVRY